MSQYWFKAKRYGYGWYPVTWQGWFSVALYIALLVLHMNFAFRYASSAEEIILGVVFPSFLEVALLIMIAYASGEKARWRWG